MTEGSLAAIDAIEAATGQQNVNTVGYCLGGTLQACTLAYLAAKGDDRVKSSTFFASLTDFSEPGELGLFIDDDHLKIIDAQMERDGYMDGATMANTFNSLRSNDLIWSFVVNNYLMGKEPMPFDLLYWNSDATRLPRAMHHYYLREMYIDNKLVEPGALTLLNTPIDLGAVKTPVYIVSTKGGSHRSVATEASCLYTTVQRTYSFHPRWFRPHRWYHQPAIRQQIRLLDARTVAANG